MCPQPLASTLNASTSAVRERSDAGSDGTVQAESRPSLKTDPTGAAVVVEALVRVDR